MGPLLHVCGQDDRLEAISSERTSAPAPESDNHSQARTYDLSPYKGLDFGTMSGTMTRNRVNGLPANSTLNTTMTKFLTELMKLCPRDGRTPGPSRKTTRSKERTVSNQVAPTADSRGSRHETIGSVKRYVPRGRQVATFELRPVGLQSRWRGRHGNIVQGTCLWLQDCSFLGH